MRTERTMKGFLVSAILLLAITLPLALPLLHMADKQEMLERENADLKDKLQVIKKVRPADRIIYSYVCDDNLRRAFAWKKFVDPVTGDTSEVWMGPCKAL
jgi:hypothetical protein